MSQHPNARLTPRGRAPLCERVGGGMHVSDAARGRGAVEAAAGPARVGRRDGRAGPHLRRDRGPQGPAAPGRRRPRPGRAARPRPRRARALRARAPLLMFTKNWFSWLRLSEHDGHEELSSLIKETVPPSP